MKIKRKLKIGHILKLFVFIILIFSIISTVAIAIAHSIVFRRADYNDYNSEHYLLYSDLDENQYPRENLKITSGKNILTGFLYGADSTKGLIIISPGHRDPNDVKLYEITYFVDAGWAVLCYDYTGCYNSGGNNMSGYTQAVYDLDAVLDYVENEERFQALPTVLFGHSLGAYASAAVLQYGHKIKSAVIASGFDTPKEQWEYSIKRYTGIFHYAVLPYTDLFITMKYGSNSKLSAVNGINSVDIPILVISGTSDSYYGGESPIYKARNKITNSQCTFELMTKENHNGHYDYFLTDAAVKYQALVSDKAYNKKIDKEIYAQHDVDFMNYIHSFLINSIQ